MRLDGVGGAGMLVVQEHGQLLPHRLAVGDDGVFEQPLLNGLRQMAPGLDDSLA
jgi:hypothetical protein